MRRVRVKIEQTLVMVDEGKKKAKNQRLAVATIVVARNGSLCILDRGSNSPPQDEPNEVPNSQGMQDNSNKEASKKKTRGKTKLLILTKEKTKGSRVVVELNLADQPFRDNAARFLHS
ncbi:unnamed protein product [Prunus armeniaca]|uniref:Uncharacterized protein n=1 Tax=Prunus armeniaca TaxID=36596 RepID=A0A6J5X799_PRUAR|nr:unnamed protein product [Prunus armeniaca]